MTSMFWGLRLEPGKRYSTTVDKSFHVSMAALDCTTVKSEKEVHSVMLEEGESNIPFILCNLQKPKVIQSPLNLNFVSGDRVTFFCRGNGTVHLTGYLITEDDDDFGVFGEEGEEVEEEEDEEEEEEDGVEEEQVESIKSKAKQNGLPAKRKTDEPAKANQKKKPKVDLTEQTESDGSDEDEDDEDDDEEEEEMEDESLDEEVESDEESEENEETSETEVGKPQPQQVPQQQQKKNKKQKKQQQQQQAQQKQQPAQQSPAQQGKQKQQANGPQQSPGQQKKKQGNEEKTPEAAAVPTKKTLEGGVIVKDLKVGNGPVCKPGRMVSVYYVGRLKSNNKVFDQTTQGAGFKFRVGRGEVIKGWDVGLSGMKVGGKRLITCPPNMAYGQKGSPPTIPGNSTLMFEVELKAVN